MSQRPVVKSKSELQSPQTNSASRPWQPALSDFIRLAKADTSGLVRPCSGLTLQRLPVSQRAGLAAALLATQNRR